MSYQPPPLPDDFAPLARGLAHEIKNPLSAIGLSARLIEEDVQHVRQVVGEESALGLELEKAQKRARTLVREAARLRDILEDFLRYAGRVEPAPVAVDLHALLTELAMFFEPQAAQARIRLQVRPPARPVVAMADPALLKQALLNLLLNAVQAMQEAREADAAHGGADSLWLACQDLGQGRVAVQVDDNGPGIPPERLPRIFEPYFSTKRGGAGLGLPTVRRIAAAHGGSAAVQGAPGRGSEFTIILPAAPPVPSPATTHG